jgi:hypothetical protein
MHLMSLYVLSFPRRRAKPLLRPVLVQSSRSSKLQCVRRGIDGACQDLGSQVLHMSLPRGSMGNIIGEGEDVQKR